MLQNAKVTAFIISGLLSENQQGGGGGGLPPHLSTQIRVKQTAVVTVLLFYVLNIIKILYL